MTSEAYYLFGSAVLPGKLKFHDIKILNLFENGEVLCKEGDDIEISLFHFLMRIDNFQEAFDTLISDRSSEETISIETFCDCCLAPMKKPLKFMESMRYLSFIRTFFGDDTKCAEEGHICRECIRMEKGNEYRWSEWQWSEPNNNFGKITTGFFSELIELCDDDGEWESRLFERLNMLEYSDFLKTPYWRVISFFVKSKYRWMCANCRNKSNLAVHHKTYKNHGMEHRKWDTDLVCLCNSCHQKEHSK